MLAVIRHNARVLLSCERVILNLMQHLSGIATLTRQYVDAIQGTKARVLDTRKTVPGLRALEKYAVLCGGGTNHRLDLASGILIKNNHISLGGGLRTALTHALERRRTGQRVQVEVRTQKELEEALECGAEAILLDNMTPAQVKNAVERIRKERPLDSHRGLGRHRARQHSRLCRDGRGLHQRGRADSLGQGRRYLHEHCCGAELGVYDLAALEAELAGTIFAGKLHFSPVTGSTNTDALAAARDGAPHGSVYFADEQTAGRGRGDHAGIGRGRGLVCERAAAAEVVAGASSADCRWRRDWRRQRRSASIAGLAVDLRWPNDLLIGPRKTGGILVESKTEADALAFAVVGIGINVHQRAFDPDIATPATSLDIEAGRRISRQALLVALLKSLERETLVLAIPEASWRNSWRVSSRLQPGSKDGAVEVHGPQACVGVTAGLDAQGFLLVRTAEGLVTVQTGGIRAAETE